MWTDINATLFVLGVISFVFAWKTDSSTNQKSFVFIFAGVALWALSLISSIAHFVAIAISQ